MHGAVIEAETLAKSNKIQFRAMVTGVAISPQVVFMYQQGTYGIQID
ncbi:hypothetical protein LJR231_003440 [Phyllobacterium sp. LjRoot231]